MSANNYPHFCRYCGATRNPIVPLCEKCGADFRQLEATIPPASPSTPQHLSPPNVQQVPSYCINCRNQLKPGIKFCGSCGTSLTPSQTQFSTPQSPLVKPSSPIIAPSAPINYPSSPQQPFYSSSNQYFKPSSKPMMIPKTKSPLMKIVAVMVTIALFFTTLVIVKRYRVVTPDENSYTFNPQTVKKSGTPALDIHPISEIHLTAQANALDKERDFQATKISSEDFANFASGLEERKSLVVAAFELNAGMNKEDRFPGELVVGFDLAQLPLQKEYWQFAEILYLDEKGHFTRLVTNLAGTELQCQIRHNGIFIVTITTLALAIPFFALVNQYQKDGGELQYWDKTENFCIYWPANANLPPQNPDSIKLMTELAERFQEYTDLSYKDLEKKFLEFGFAADRYFQWLLQQPNYQKYHEDFRVREILRLISDNKWRRENLWPIQVAHTMTVLERAYIYLVNGNIAGNENCRKFRKPGWVIDVYLKDNWQELDTINGLCKDKPFTFPYLDFRLTAIPTLAKITDEADQKKIDELNTTALHELFHAISKYNYIEGEDDLWFDEACAATLEHEAKNYYKPFVSNYKTTGRDYWKFYQLAMETRLWDQGDMDKLLGSFDGIQESNSSLYQDHGYNASYFFEFLREKYYTKNPNDFLPNLLENFATWRGGTVASLVNITSQDPQEFGNAFLEFCQNKERSAVIEKSIPTANQVSLTIDKPYFHWKLNKVSPLAAIIRNISLASIPETDLKDAKVVYKGSELPQKEIQNRWRPYGKHWSDLLDKEAVVDYGDLVNKNSKGLYVQRLEAVTERGTIHNGHSTSIFVLLTPKAPEITTNEDGIKINWTTSPLIKVNFVRDQQMVIEVQGGKEIVKEVTIPPLEIPFSELAPDFGNDNSSLNISVRFRERANTESEIFGPWSPTTYKTVTYSTKADAWFLAETKIEDPNPSPDATELSGVKFGNTSFAGHYKMDSPSDTALDVFIEGEWGQPPDKLIPLENLSIPVTINRTWNLRPQKGVRTGFVVVALNGEQEVFENSGVFTRKIPYAQPGTRMVVNVDAMVVNYFFQQRRVFYTYVYGGKDIPAPTMPVGTNPAAYEKFEKKF